MSKKSKDVIPTEGNLWVRLMMRANEERDLTDLGDTVLADLLEEAASEIKWCHEALGWCSEWYRDDS